MARGGGQIFQVQQAPLAPNAAQAIGAGLQDFSSALLQHFAQKEQLALQKEALKLQQQEFQLTQQKREAEGQAALQAIQSNPELLALLGGGGASTLQAPQLPTQAPAAYASAQGAPAPQVARTSTQQAPLAPARPGGALTPEVASALLPILQDQRRTDAQLAESQARTRTAKLEERRLAFEIDNAPKLFELNQRRIEADIAASEASGAASRAQAETARGQLALAQREYEGALRRTAADQANKLDERYSNAIASGLDKASASRWVYGTPEPPKRNALVASLTQELDPVISAAGSAEDVNALSQAREMQRAVDRLGVSQELQTAVMQSLQTHGTDFERVFEDARRSGMRNEDKVRVALMIEAMTGQMPDLSSIPDSKHWLKRIFESIPTNAASVNAGMMFN